MGINWEGGQLRCAHLKDKNASSGLVIRTLFLGFGKGGKVRDGGRGGLMGLFFCFLCVLWVNYCMSYKHELNNTFLQGYAGLEY